MHKKHRFGKKQYYIKRLYIYLGMGALLICILLIVSIFLLCKRVIRLDQYASTIFSTTAGIVGSMFGLTAASYAFIWGDLRSDRQSNRHLGKVLERYREKIWKYFVCSLILTIIVIFSSLVGLAFVQNITDPSLYKTVYNFDSSVSSYYNDKSVGISLVVFFNLVASFVVILIMAAMNWTIFRRNDQYALIAKGVMNHIEHRYDMTLEMKYRQRTSQTQKEKKGDINSLEYEKIHNLEILVERILKNHESIGEAFAETQRREKLLTSVITNGLRSRYNVDGFKGEERSENSSQRRMEWGYLNDGKRRERWKNCYAQAQKEYGMLSGQFMIQEKNLRSKPRECGFISVYDDLLGYRDNSLIYEENRPQKQSMQISMWEKRSLRYTVKKRLLIFYLQGEMFSDMDLTGISFSGGDLRFTNFTNCNLTRVRLMGANCEGADFTGTKMTGMYFDDAGEDNEIGEIKLTCHDDAKEIWDPYIGEEATCLKEATFKNADVSRAYLKAPGKLCRIQQFPYGRQGENMWQVEENQPMFSLEGTNFDNAKMFFSYFKNIDFTNSSLERAQMYNTGLVLVKAKSGNFAYATLTKACIAWCDFENADFTSSSLIETILTRVNFNGSKLKNANFSYSNITDCSFEGVSCQNASFKNMIQDRAILKTDKPKALRDIDVYEPVGIRFHYAILTSADFSGAVLDDISFWNTIGQDCVFTKALGKNMVFDSSLFTSSIFNATKIQNSRLKNTIFRNSVFVGTSFVNATFEKVDFSNILLNTADDLCFYGGYMQNVNFSGARGLTADSFKNIVLRRVDFSETNIRRCDFSSDTTIDACVFEK